MLAAGITLVAVVLAVRAIVILTAVIRQGRPDAERFRGKGAPPAPGAGGAGRMPGVEHSKPLSPKLLVLSLRDHAYAKAVPGPAPTTAPARNDARWTSSTSITSSRCAATRC